MLELLGEIYLYLMIAGVLGFLAGWLLKAVHAQAEAKIQLRSHHRENAQFVQQVAKLEKEVAMLEKALCDEAPGSFGSEELADALAPKFQELSSTQSQQLKSQARKLQSLEKTVKRRDQKNVQLEFLFQSMLEDRDHLIEELQQQVNLLQNRMRRKKTRPIRAEDPRQGDLFSMTETHELPGKP